MADETPAPLSDAEMREIAERAAHMDGSTARRLIAPLLATLAARDDRLAALERENAALRAALRDVLAAADGSVGLYTPSEHLSVTRARALLATPPQQATT